MIGIFIVCCKNENYLSLILLFVVNYLCGVKGVFVVVCVCDIWWECRENIKINLM